MNGPAERLPNSSRSNSAPQSHGLDLPLDDALQATPHLSIEVVPEKLSLEFGTFAGALQPRSGCGVSGTDVSPSSEGAQATKREGEIMAMIVRARPLAEDAGPSGGSMRSRLQQPPRGALGGPSEGPEAVQCGGACRSRRQIGGEVGLHGLVAREPVDQEPLHKHSVPLQWLPAQAVDQHLLAPHAPLLSRPCIGHPRPHNGPVGVVLINGCGCTSGSSCFQGEA
mmetsp:Transcript_115379/g.366948  ORF Transcript_115379/g.366948 Transcript_115379/m.366948 type:complete len:225 (-) Transcript_115379:72-746(-)